MVFFTVCAFVGLDTLGTVASNGPQGFFWLVALALVFVLPYALADGRGRLELLRGGRAVRVDEARLGPLRRRDRRDPLLGHEPALGRRLARVHRGRGLAARTSPASGTGPGATTSSSCSFIWISIGVAIASLRYGKWIPNLGAFLRFFTLGLFSITVVVYGAEHGFHGFSAHDASPTPAVFIGLVPVLLFNYVGFELQNGAAEEMENPSRDVPISVFQAGVLGVLSYVIPILGILLVLPLDQVTGIGGFIDAVTEVFSRLRRRGAHAARS